MPQSYSGDLRERVIGTVEAGASRREAADLFEISDTTRLVFIDETAITTNMVRIRGRCPRGERLVSHVPQGERKTITFIAGLRHNRMTAPMVIERAMDGPPFLSYIEECLGPTLKPGDTVVMDHCPIHKVAGVEEAIEARGARVEYLPKYSPDLNPIELS